MNLGGGVGVGGWAWERDESGVCEGGGIRGASVPSQEYQTAPPTPPHTRHTLRLKGELCQKPCSGTNMPEPEQSPPVGQGAHALEGQLLKEPLEQGTHEKVELMLVRYSPGRQLCWAVVQGLGLRGGGEQGCGRGFEVGASDAVKHKCATNPP